MCPGVLVCRKQFFGTASLHNIVPSELSHGWEPQVEIFEGLICVCELMSKSDDIPWYRIVFEWKGNDVERPQGKDTFFGQTAIMKGTSDLNKTVKNREEWFEVLMECPEQRLVALELRIKDIREDQNFRDLLFRIREEYEMIDEMMEESDDFGDFIG
ncbi:LAQU0S20e00628g1_1 [Lachancea quebecensis]|uniref:LAQU0S20e00628g1_1 n=1 Tax=Lachancea quebecensis TaxID=1654605 RepID=A0A0P1KX75_9SACH|nr:LAQU0S20e00628g1_1 [Lachancea quebecensis]